jgi:hypothetical protein
MHSNPQKNMLHRRGLRKGGNRLGTEFQGNSRNGDGSSATEIVSDSQFGKATLCDGAPSGGNEGTDYA